VAVHIKLNEGESVESLLRRFKKTVANAKVITIARMHKEFMNPREKRKFKAEKAKGKKRS